MSLVWSRVKLSLLTCGITWTWTDGPLCLRNRLSPISYVGRSYFLKVRRANYYVVRYTRKTITRLCLDWFYRLKERNRFLFIPKVICVNAYCPICVLKFVNTWFFGVTMICQYQKVASKVFNTFVSPCVFVNSSILWIRYESQTIMVLKLF